MSSICGRFGLLATLLLLSWVPCTVAGSPKPIAVLPLETYLGRSLAIRASINRHEGRFLFDTGVGVTMISPSLADALGCKPWGNLTGFRMTGERLYMPHCDGLIFESHGVSLPAPIVGVMDIMTLFDSDVPKLDGAVGFDAFAGRAITLIIQRKQLVVESKGSLAARVRAATEIAVRVVRDAEGVALAVDVAVPTANGRAWMELDSGNGGSIVVSRAVAPLLNLDPAADKPQAGAFNIAAGITVAGKIRTPQGNDHGRQHWLPVSRKLVLNARLGERTGVVGAHIALMIVLLALMAHGSDGYGMTVIDLEKCNIARVTKRDQELSPPGILLKKRLSARERRVGQ